MTVYDYNKMLRNQISVAQAQLAALNGLNENCELVKTTSKHTLYSVVNSTVPIDMHAAKEILAVQDGKLFLASNEFQRMNGTNKWNDAKVEMVVMVW